MKTSNTQHQRGVTLIELMIGLALGLIASLAIFSTISTFEAQRRTTSSGVDMQQNGLVSLYSIEQDIRMSGFGLIDSANSSMPCVTINAYGTNSSVMDSAPVSITAGTSDTITISRFDSDSGGIVTGGQAAKLTAATVTGTAPTTITVDTAKAFPSGDFILLANSGTCSLFKNTTSPTAAATSLTLQNVKNPAGVAGTPTTPAYPVGTSVVDIGQPQSGLSNPSFTSSKYSIDSNNNLQRTINDNAGSVTTSVIANNIANMQVQYGVANTGSQTVSCWTDAVANSATCPGPDWSNPLLADIKRIKAIRIAIVAKSAQPAGSCTATTQPTSWAGWTANPNGIDNWGWSACYRYKVYQTVIPIRNVIWGKL